MIRNITEIEGVGPASARKLAKVGIRTTAELLKDCGHRKGRRATADTTGLTQKQLLRWANMADLMRISGIGPEFSELLEVAGVDTIKELRKRRSDNLIAKLAAVNGSKRRTRRIPSLSMVQRWIARAKELNPAISH